MVALTEDTAFHGVVEVLIEVRPDLAEHRDRITRDTGLFYGEDPSRPALELDSMDALELLSALERHFALELSDTGVRVVDLRTVGDVVDAIVRAV